jgi:uncharacterized protein (DUF433 family)
VSCEYAIGGGYRDLARPGPKPSKCHYTLDAEADTLTLSIAAEQVPLSLDTQGTVRVGGTRLTLETVVAAFKRGDSPQEIVAGFPGLDLADVYSTIAYYLRHRQDVEAYLQDQEATADESRQKVDALQGDPLNLRERLIAHRARRQNP